MLSRVSRTIREQDLFQAGDRVLLAVSGGPDSTALLHVIHALAVRLGLRLHVACVDHGLRPESADEARGVRDSCAALGLACDILSVDVKRGRRAHGSIQEAARIVRLRALEEAADRLGCSKIALGHTADDQAETVLFRIIRGTGIAGLSGIPYRRERLVRPLLDVRRAEILAYLAKRKLGFFSDPSNLSRRYARSRIRHDVLPALCRENPRVVDALLALAHEARGRSQPSWKQVIPKDAYLPRRALQAVERLVSDARGTHRVAVQGGQVVVAYGKVTWQPMSVGARATDDLDASVSKSMSIETPGSYPIPWLRGASVEVASFQTRPHVSASGVLFDAGKLRWPLSLRTKRPGDRMKPRGGRGSRKLSDLLIDGKVPRDDRIRLPVLCDAEGTILFVPGLRPSETGRPDGGTRDCLEVRLAR